MCEQGFASGAKSLGTAERKSRDRAQRERRIVDSARFIAETEGWSAVTIRRLAEEIEYSQPVLYSHFEHRDAIVAAVAIEGFRELAVELRRGSGASISDRDAAEGLAKSYLTFAKDHPALYEAMFTMPIGLLFADPETKPELRSAFAALSAAVPASCRDRDLVTETFWSALHGLAELERTSRIRPGACDKRMALVVDALLVASTNVLAPAQPPTS